jgi:predicted permease
MAFVSWATSLWRNLFRRTEVEQDLTDEINAHLEMLIDINLQQGATPAEARRLALIEIGGPEQVKEQVREVRIGHHLEMLGRDIRYGLRGLLRSPGFTAAAGLSLALGIGANTAIFSVIDALAFKKLPIQNPEQLLSFAGASHQEDEWDIWPYSFFERWRDRTTSFANIAASGEIERSNVMLNGPDGVVEAGRVRVGLVSGNYFATLGINAAQGRTLSPDDDRAPGESPITVISYDFWEQRFGRTPDIIGRTVTINGGVFTIVGVAPAAFAGDVIGHPIALWVPTQMETQVMPERPNLVAADWKSGWAWVRIIARLKPDVTAPQAQAAATVVFQQILAERAQQMGYTLRPEYARQQISLLPAGKGNMPERRAFAPPLTILMIVVVVVLLIACANVANLLLARSTIREKEMAVRLALGAGRRRIVRQLLTESLLLALLGGVVGLLFARWGTKALLQIAASGLDPIDLDLHPDTRSLLFTSALCLLAAMLFGLAPALRAPRLALTAALNRRGIGSVGTFSGRAAEWLVLRKSLVVFQVALSLALLIGAGLFLRTLTNLKSQALGFDRERTLLVWTGPVEEGRSNPAVATLHQQMYERISSLPGVVSASGAVYGVLNGRDYTNGSETFKVEGQPPKSGLRWVQSLVGPRFFETLGLPLLQGRAFNPVDATMSAPRVAIVNETMAHFIFGDQSPIGKHFASLDRDVGYPVEVVGVVTDSKHATLRDKDLGVVYVPERPADGRAGAPMCLVVRTSTNPTGVAARIRQELHNLDPNVPVLAINTVDQQLNELLVSERLLTMLSSILGALAVLLACIGLYGVISYRVTRRTNEIGIRLALGATSAQVLLMVLRESLWPVLAGVVIGVLVASAGARLMSAMLFGVGAADPLTTAAASLLMIAVAALAALIPARRAARVDPMTALRYE